MAHRKSYSCELKQGRRANAPMHVDCSKQAEHLQLSALQVVDPQRRARTCAANILQLTMNTQTFTRAQCLASHLCRGSSLRSVQPVHIGSLQRLPQTAGNERVSHSSKTTSRRSSFVTLAESGNGASPAPSGLTIDLKGKKAFIAGVADDQGFGWAIAKALAEAGAEISLGVWVPALSIFESSLRRGKFDANRKLANGGMLEFTNIYPMDAVYDTPEDVPEDVASNKRYAAASGKGFTVSEVADQVSRDSGKIDILVHSLANGPEVTKPLLETSRRGYLAALSASSYSYVSMVQRFGPLMNPGGAAISLTYIASERIIPGYGGGMSSAKAALESDTRVLAYEAGRRFQVRVNTISAGPLGSRAAKAIGFIEDMIRYSYENAPVQKELQAREVGNAAAFLLSPLASAITGSLVYVDNGLNCMGLATDSQALLRPEEANAK